jgi:hypothetical protein
MQKVIMYGGSGFVGSYLVPALEEQGYFVVVCDQMAPRFNFKGKFIECDIMNPLRGQWSYEHESYLSNPYAVINLAGKNIFGKFTDEHKQAIYDSRITGTRIIIESFQEPRFKPRVYITASAVGYYGDQGNTTIVEQGRMGKNFLATVVADWEGEARRVEEMGIRLVMMRQGHVLGAGGMVEFLKPYYAKGIGGPIGLGRFYFPWIHVEDLVGYYSRALSNDSVRGMYNVVVGDPITYREFSKAFAQSMKKPHFLFIPPFALKLRFGEFADEIMASQKIVPQRIKTMGYEPIFTNIWEAMEYQVGK